MTATRRLAWIVAVLAILAATVAYLLPRTDTTPNGDQASSLVLDSPTEELPETPRERSEPQARAQRTPEKRDRSQTVLTGTVRWKRAGKPAVGVHVRVTSRAGPRIAVTDDTGTYRFGKVEPGRAYVQLDRSGVQRKVAVARDDTTRLDLTIAAGIRVEGRVVGPKGMPVAGARVRISASSLASFDVTRCDANGQFVVADVEPGRTIDAWAPGFSPPPMLVVDGSPGDTMRVTIRFPAAGGSIDFRVVDADTNEPVGNALVHEVLRVKASTMTADGRERKPTPPRFVRTSDSGYARIDGLPIAPFAFSVRARGYSMWHGAHEVVQGRSSTCSIKLARTATVRGRVTTTSGAPIERATVYAARRRTTTNEEGVFALEGLPPGKLRLRVRSKRHGSTEQRVELLRGKTLEWNPVLDPGPVLHGKLSCADGKAAAGWNVQLDDKKSVRTDRSGYFRFIGLERGRLYRLRARWNKEPLSFVHASFRRRPSDAELALVVPPNARAHGGVSGHVLDRSGKPLPRFHLMVEQLLPGEEPVLGYARTRRSGYFFCRAMPPGRYRVVLHVPKKPPVTIAEFALSAKEHKKLGEIRRD